MTIGIYVESNESNNLVNQTLITPTPSEVKIFARQIDKSNPQARCLWQVTTQLDMPESGVTKNPIAVIMTDRDMEALTRNVVSTLGVKAIRAYETYATETGLSQPHDKLVQELVDRLKSADQSLNDLVTDNRRNNPIILRPIPYEQEVTNRVVNVDIQTPEKQPSYSMPMATIPDMKWSRDYITRKLVSNLTEFEVYDNAMRNHENILLEGHAGSGKTMSVLAYASARGHRYYNVSSHIGLEASQLFGKWIPTPDGHFRWQDGAVTELVRNGGVLLLNEVNFMPERVTTVLFGLLDARREIQLMDNNGEVIKAHNELLVIADMNPNYRGTRPMNQAWKDRFHHIIEFPYDKSIETKLVKSPALINLANQLRDEFDKEAIETPISTRKLVAFINNANNLGLDYATYCFVNGFAEHERQAVKLVMETHKANLVSDLVPDTNKVVIESEVTI
jgi:hypothetical protein